MKNDLLQSHFRACKTFTNFRKTQVSLAFGDTCKVALVARFTRAVLVSRAFLRRNARFLLQPRAGVDRVYVYAAKYYWGEPFVS